MRVVQDIVFGVAGQLLVFDVPEGRPSSVTSVTPYRWDQPDETIDELAAGAPTVETNPNTTVSGGAGPTQLDPRNVPLTATTGCTIGRDYLLTGATGLQEWVEVASVTAATSILAKHPLHNTYASGALFQSTRIQATVDPTWVADETNLDATSGPSPMFRVRWQYVVAGVTYVADAYFNLVRYQGWHGVRPQDVEALYPGWLDRLPSDHQSDQGRRLIDEAYRAVQIDLEQVGVDDSSVAHSQVMDELARYKVVQQVEWLRFLLTADTDETRHLAAKREYMARLDSLVRVTLKVPIRDKEGAAGTVLALPLERR